MKPVMTKVFCLHFNKMCSRQEATVYRFGVEWGWGQSGKANGVTNASQIRICVFRKVNAKKANNI